MEIYEFKKCLLDRLGESISVLLWKNKSIPASHVGTEWSYFIELQAEPTGWQALWKIPRALCEQLNVRFPTIVFGFVEQILFKEIKAIFKITAVTDDSIRLPELQEVALEDLWPTRAQENKELNVEQTADALDKLRFFYTHVWMPWDNENDDDFNWTEQTLELRIRLILDLRQGKIERPLAAYIRSLISEAKYVQNKLYYLETDISDDEEDIVIDSVAKQSRLTDLMRLRLRLSAIRTEFEMFENPDLRHVYQEVRSKDIQSIKIKSDSVPVCYVVLLSNSVEYQMEILRAVKEVVPDKSQVFLNHSLQDVLNVCKSSDKIYLSPGRHAVNFREYFNNNGVIYGLGSLNIENSIVDEKTVTLYSRDGDESLLIFNGNFSLVNVVIDCKNISTGIIVKSGSITLTNCKLLGKRTSSIQQGILCYDHSNLKLERCLIEDFGTGIMLQNNSSIILNNSSVSNCYVGLDMSEYAQAQFIAANILNSEKSGILYDSAIIDKSDEMILNLQKLDDIKRKDTNSVNFDN
uniref:Uncharacterized protein n=1 Tax=Glossina brevipalpis TaxID=37001 RepID=A0A1A9WEX0_9MUSC